MKLTLQSRGPALRHVAVQGDIRSPGDFELNDPLRQLLGDCRSLAVLLNLERATSIDAGGIDWLLRCRRRAVSSRGELVLHSAPPGVLRALRLLSLHKVFRCVESYSAATALATEGSRAC